MTLDKKNSFPLVLFHFSTTTYYISLKITLLFILFSTFFPAQYSITSAERNALLSIYQSTDGNNWSQTWDLNKDPQNWYGIKIKNHVVTGISLRGNFLKGSFPSNLSAFSSLQVLDLSNNNLSGDVPLSVGTLTNLVSLSFNDNKLTGDPSAALSSLSNLAEFSIGHNLFNIADLDILIQNFSQLKVLNIAGLNLNAVPPKIATLTKLESLDLSDNQLKTGFDNLSSLINLKEFNLAGNQLSKLPTQLGTLTKLTTLDLSRNLLATNFESPLSNLKNLEWLSLENNLLENLPSNIGTLTNLVHLNLGRNLLAGNFSALLSLKNLEQLYLNHNILKDSFPTDLLQLSTLQMLSLTGNQLSGTIPAKIPALTFIDDNRFSLSDIKTFLDKKSKLTDFTYSPQRYDDPLSVPAAFEENVVLKQSLSGDDYQFSWFKNLEDRQSSTSENFYINGIKQDDYTNYTCEAYFAKNYTDYFLEISFYREPVTLVSTLSTSEIDKNLSIYPNPTSDLLFIRAVNEKVESISIFDMSGKMIFSDSGPSKLRVNVHNFPSGAYVILLKMPTSTKTFKFIKK
ncbi:T9SS type A sorting domain-containing protein [Halpernia frigidisoli]|uniref:Por secretion system C-terminal sorting domain-containing protein n=1 Tax=Halpernia frigidisoli TaxID=1125876 RepID=A0A1I3FZP1_9FLAO|nr:T9SS type A sorting domain-containing protein [Halpernia frigidisoli]SFI16695.1 Por secretion system C-terminal sorting domain-containing protein [Halpernia frigidisoli]